MDQFFSVGPPSPFKHCRKLLILIKPRRVNKYFNITISYSDGKGGSIFSAEIFGPPLNSAESEPRRGNKYFNDFCFRGSKYSMVFLDWGERK